MKKSLLGLFLLFHAAFAMAKPTLYVYQWINSIPDSVYKQFTKETGVPVDVSYYESNEAMYAKLKGNPSLAYDVVFPSSYFIKRMVKAHLLDHIDSSIMTHTQGIYKKFIHQPFDPNNDYSYPLTWGMTGIAVNDKYIPLSKITAWKDLWSPSYRHQVLWLNDIREPFSVALIRLGYSVNDQNPTHIKQAYALLKKGLPNVKVINADAMESMFIDEDVFLGMAWSPDTYQASQSNPHIHFVIPKGRYPLWLGCMAIPQGSRHPKLAMTLLNFLLRKDISAQIITGMGYAVTNQEAVKSLPISWQEKRFVNPSKSLLARGEIEGDVGDKARQWYEHYWLELRLSV